MDIYRIGRELTKPVCSKGLAYGVTNQSPPYVEIGENFAQYIKEEFLPPPHQRPKGFSITKIARMDAEALTCWIKYLIGRQEMQKRGEITTVFAFKKPKSKKSKSKSEKKKAKKSASRPAESVDSSDEEVHIELALQKESTPTTDNENDQQLNGGNGMMNAHKRMAEEGIQEHSPSSASANWASKLSFLRSLSTYGPYLALISILESHQVTFVPLYSYPVITNCDIGRLPPYSAR